MCYFIDCQANVSEGRSMGANVKFTPSKKGDKMNESPCDKTENICFAEAHNADAVASVWFAYYLHAFLHLATDVTPACEHCRTSIWNVLGRNPISGFNGSPEAAHPGSCEIYALVKLVYSINFPHFQLLTLLLCMPLCFFFSFCTKSIKPVLGRSRGWGQLMWLQISWWDWLIHWLCVFFSVYMLLWVYFKKKMTFSTAELKQSRRIQTEFKEEK